MSNAASSPVAFVAGQIATTVNQQAAERFEAGASGYANDPVPQQIQYLNRYWRRQLAALNVDTISAREALIDDCAYNEWQSLFIRHVLPLIIKHNLPA